MITPIKTRKSLITLLRARILAMFAVVALPPVTVNADLGVGIQPVVAIHDSELTRALASVPASPPTPNNATATGFEWWPTNWPYFVMPESVMEALRSDGTAFEVLSDADIGAGKLLDTNGVPRYPIVISLASEAIADEAIAQFTNYVAAGGFLLAGSSSFTRNTNGTSRGDFAFGDEMGIHCINPGLTNWVFNTTFARQSEHRLVRHLPDGVLTWGLASAAEEIPWGVSPGHAYLPPHLIWQVASSNATVIGQGNSRPYLLVKQYGDGCFIYHAAMQPLIGHGGWAPGMYAYSIFREAIQWAFESAKIPVAKLGPWPFEYDAAFTVRHDLENYQDLISNVAASAQFEHSHGVKGDYYFCTGTLREDMSNSNAAIAGLRSAVTDYGATIGSHNGGLRNPHNPALNKLDYDYWHWGPDEALDVIPTNYANGKAYALASISNSFVDIETWLAGLTNTRRVWVGCYFNSTREDSYDILSQLGVKVAGEQKLSPFPHYTVSTRTSGKRYATLTLPVSDWYVGSQVLQIAQSMEAGHTLSSVREMIDHYYELGALINLYSHTLATGFGEAGERASDYVTYAMNTNAHPRLWAANALELHDWWEGRSNVLMTASYTNTGVERVLHFTISGTSHPSTAVEALIPGPGSFTGLRVFTNGVTVGEGGYRVCGQCVKILVGNSVGTATVSYFPAPAAQQDNYGAVMDTTLTVESPGVLANDTASSDATNLTAEGVSAPAHGQLILKTNGGFDYTPETNFTGWDGFTYRVFDGVTNSASALVLLSIVPPGALLFDDFLRPAGLDSLMPWQVALGSWAMTNGVLLGTSAVQSYGSTFVGSNWTDYVVEGRIRFPVGAFGGGLGGRVNRVTGARYGAWVYPEGSLGGSSVVKLLKFRGWQDWNGVPMQQANLSGVGTNWHTLKLTFQGNRIRVLYDDNPMLDAMDDGFGGQAAMLSGGISADMWTYTTAYAMLVDDVLVGSLSGTPVANDDGFSTPAGSALHVPAPGVLTNDTGGTAALSAVLVGSPSHGTLVLTNNGGFTYTSTNNYVGLDVFTYRATDGQTNSAAATVTINVTSTNHVPVVKNDSFRYAANHTLIVDPPGVLANDSDLDGGPLTTVLVTGPSNGILDLSPDGGFTYTPATNFTDEDSFTYQATDGLTNSGTATVVLRDSSAGALLFDDFSRPASPGDLSPWVVQSGSWVLVGDTLQGRSSLQEYGFACLTNVWTNYTVETRIRFESGAYGGGLGARVNPVTGSRYAAWIYPAGPPGSLATLRLIKFQDWTSWGYTNKSFAPMAQVSLPNSGTNWHTLKLALHGKHIAVYYDENQVLSVSDVEVVPLASGGVSADIWTDLTPYAMSLDDVIVSPLLIDDNYSMSANATLNVAVPGVLGNDTATYSSELAAMAVSGPTNGILNLLTNGGFAYTPDFNFSGWDGFTYQANDGQTNLGTAQVAIWVTPLSSTNSPPVIQSIAATNGVVVIRWSAMTGHTYRLQYKDTLGDTNWNSLAPDFQAGATTIAGTNTVGNLPRRFYRVMLVP